MPNDHIYGHEEVFNTKTGVRAWINKRKTVCNLLSVLCEGRYHEFSVSKYRNKVFHTRAINKQESLLPPHTHTTAYSTGMCQTDCFNWLAMKSKICSSGKTLRVNVTKNEVLAQIYNSGCMCINRVVLLKLCPHFFWSCLGDFLFSTLCFILNKTFHIL